MLPDEIAPADLEACRRLLAKGSKTFALAGAALPAQLRTSATVLYAFCRIADDRIDGAGTTASAAAGVAELEARLAAIYAGRPADDPVDRALAVVVRQQRIPERVFAALLEGFAWDATGRRYERLEDLHDYAARVAGTVGVMLCHAMDRRDFSTLARAAELGIAMQLTNIARDVGEDARRGRIYLPLTWMREADIDPDRFVARPVASPALARIVRRLLREAERLYQRADVGLARLPRACQPAMRAARLLYAEIGRVIAANGYDSVSRRAVVSGWRKAVLLFEAAQPLPAAAGGDPAPLPAATFLLPGAAELAA